MQYDVMHTTEKEHEVNSYTVHMHNDSRSITVAEMIIWLLLANVAVSFFWK
jgi:hypothetical protein